MPQQTPPIAPTELFARLAGGHAARVTVVTPNRRLAQSLQREFDRLQLAAGRASWEAPDILPFATFLARCHEDARFAAWRRAYARGVGSQLDRARLAQWVASAAGAARFPLPATLVLHAFDLVTPGQSDLVEAFARAGVEILESQPRSRNGNVRRTTLE